MSPRKLYDQSGQPMGLGTQLASGGEGAIFEVVGSSDRVAKVYHRSVPPEKAEKLRWMVRLGSPELLQFTAWPTATLHENPNGPVAGFVMPRIVGHHEAHTLYSPAQRKQCSPQADWAFLVHTAMNCAAAFDTIHQLGYVVGDVNQKNVLVSTKATISLIDCDSFQIRANGQLFPCEVGVPEYTPPELQGQTFRGIERTPNHDRFGLAVLIFHLLFMGRHPFVGRFLGRGDMPLERAIREYRFAYSRAAAQQDMAAPPHSLPLTAISPELIRLFERAFSRHFSQPNARPSAAEWGPELVRFEKQLRKCSADPGHRVPLHLGGCPWCALMQTGGPNYFVTVAAVTIRSTAATETFVLAVVWRQIEQVAPPRCAYQRPPLPANARVVPTPLPPDLPALPLPFIPVALPEWARVPRNLLQATVGWVGLAAIVVLLPACGAGAKPLQVICLLVGAVFCAWWGLLEGARLLREKGENKEWAAAFWAARAEERRHKQVMARWRRAVKSERHCRNEALQRAQEAMRRAEEHWRQEARNYSLAFSNLRSSLDALKQKCELLSAEQYEENRRLERNVQAAQLHQHLQSKFINDHSIPDIGPVRKAALRSYGIETALDIDAAKLDPVPGFGPKLTQRLLDWRVSMELEFRFDPSAGVPPSLLDAVEAKYRQRRQELELQLSKGPECLRVQSAQAENHLAQLLASIQQHLLQVAQSEADMRIVAA
jgi:DNA-binding helix-hairpin-helix protein with protein kinase domain